MSDWKWGVAPLPPSVRSRPDPGRSDLWHGFGYRGVVSDLERLQSLIQAGNTCLWITTDEEEQALRLVRDAAMALSRPVLQWGAGRGVTDGLGAPGGGGG